MSDLFTPDSFGYDSKIKLVGHLNLITDSVEFYLSASSGEVHAVADPIVYRKTQYGTFREPTFRLKHSEAQHLMDTLWNSGIRPTASKFSDGTLAAVERHLEDERALSNRLLDAILPRPVFIKQNKLEET